MVKIHGEEMPGDVESMGAEGGVADMDESEEIRQLTQLLDMEHDTGLLRSQMIYVSSDEESDGDKDSRGHSHFIHMHSWKKMITIPCK